MDGGASAGTVTDARTRALSLAAQARAEQESQAAAAPTAAQAPANDGPAYGPRRLRPRRLRPRRLRPRRLRPRRLRPRRLRPRRLRPRRLRPRRLRPRRLRPRRLRPAPESTATCNDGLNRRRNRDRQRDDRHGWTRHDRCRHGSNRGTVGGAATVRVFGELPRHQHQTCRPVSRRLSVLPLDMGLGGAPDRSCPPCRGRSRRGFAGGSGSDGGRRCGTSTVGHRGLPVRGDSGTCRCAPRQYSDALTSAAARDPRLPWSGAAPRTGPELRGRPQHCAPYRQALRSGPHRGRSSRSVPVWDRSLLALVETGAEVTAVEVDSGLARALRDVVADHDVRVVCDDARTLDWAALLAGRNDWRLVANLPYNIAASLGRRPLEQRGGAEIDVGDGANAKWGSVWRRKRATGRLGSRRCSSPTTAPRDWSGRVPATVFYPKPRVESVLVQIDRRPRSAGRGAAGIDRYPAARRLWSAPQDAATVSG